MSDGTNTGAPQHEGDKKNGEKIGIRVPLRPENYKIEEKIDPLAFLRTESNKKDVEMNHEAEPEINHEAEPEIESEGEERGNFGCHEESICICDEIHDVTFSPCEDIKEITVKDAKLSCEGRFLIVKVKLDNVCAGRRVNIGVIVLEERGCAFKTKGLKAVEVKIPGRPGTCLNNVKIGDFCFIFPEKVLCGHRKFKVNVIAHYSSFANMDIWCN